MRFEGGHHKSSKTLAVLKSRSSSKVNIHMQKTAIRDQNPTSHYRIYVTAQYVLCNKSQLQSTHSLETHNTHKIIILNEEALYPGSKSIIYTRNQLWNISYKEFDIKYPSRHIHQSSENSLQLIILQAGKHLEQTDKQ